MWWEITHSTADTAGERSRPSTCSPRALRGRPCTSILRAEESYAVLSGTLDVCVGGQWRKLAPGSR